MRRNRWLVLLMLLLTDWVVGDFEAGGFWTLVGATIIIWLVNLVIGAARHDVAKSRARPRGADDWR